MKKFFTNLLYVILIVVVYKLVIAEAEQVIEMLSCLTALLIIALIKVVR